MTTSESMTPSPDGNDNARSLSLDDAASIDWIDPEEETDPVDSNPQSDEGIEASDDMEAEEITAEEIDPETAIGDDEAAEGAEGEQVSTPEATDDATVTIDGKQLTVAELKKGYFREADYTRHKQTVSNKEKELEALSNRVTASVEAIADFLQSSLPKAPDPALAIGNAAQQSQYLREKTLHDNAMAQVAALIEKANAPKDVLKTLSGEQRKEVLASENAKLIEAFPTTATPEGRQKFFEGTTSAAKQLGFTEQELAEVTDHRLFKLAHYARIGLAAEAAKAKAKQKVANVPPVAPTKRQQPPQLAAARQKQEARKRLARSGSLDDAVAAWSGD